MIVGSVGFVALAGLELWMMYVPDQISDTDRSVPEETYIAAGQKACQQADYAKALKQ